MVTISFWALLYPTTFSLKSANVKETIKKKKKKKDPKDLSITFF